MLIYKIGAILLSARPACVIAFADGKRSGGIYNLDFRILAADCLVKIRISLKETLSYLLISYSDILKPERLLMSELRSYGSPFRTLVTVGKLNKIKRIVNPCAELLNRNALTLVRVKACR